MKALELLTESESVVIGTNCSNCRFINMDSATDPEDGDLDAQGGIKITEKAKLKLAQQADLITLPGKKTPSKKVGCEHPKVKQYVTERMCCGYWDAKGVIRQYKKVIDE